jgi:hypothetical protein
MNNGESLSFSRERVVGLQLAAAGHQEVPKFIAVGSWVRPGASATRWAALQFPPISALKPAVRARGRGLAARSIKGPGKGGYALHSQAHLVGVSLEYSDTQQSKKGIWSISWEWNDPCLPPLSPQRPPTRGDDGQELFSRQRT